MTGHRTSPQDAQKIAAHARQYMACDDCGAAPGGPCTQSGRGRSVCKARYVAAAIALRRQDRAERRTPEQEAVLASLPRVSRAEIEAHRTPKGGYRLTREWFTSHGIPYPPPPGWRRAVEGEDGVDGR